MKKLNVVLFVVVIVFSLIQTPVSAHPKNASSDFANVDRYLQATLEQFHIKGMALAIVKEDQILYMKGYGTANQAGDPATPQTPWPMASVTKSFTALAIQQLAQNGKVDLDAPVQAYLPEFQLTDKKAASSITVRQLMMHTSGLSTEAGTQGFLFASSTTYDEALSHLVRLKPENKPGEVYEYSNWNYILLGKIIEKASGQPYTTYMQQNVLTPLEMNSSTFADYHSVPHVATGNLVSYGLTIPYDERYSPFIMSAGNLTSTAEDMAHYLISFYNKGSYDGHEVLASEKLGWFDNYWNWNGGFPFKDTFYGFSGGFNSFATTCILMPDSHYGVVLLLNTRLDEVNPKMSSFVIAMDVLNMVKNHVVKVPSNLLYYGTWIIMDLISVGLIFSLFWQVFRLKKWSAAFKANTKKSKVFAWSNIIVNIIVSALLFAVPYLTNSSWNSTLSLRPDFSVPLLVTATGLGLLGIWKIGIIVSTAKTFINEYAPHL